MTSVASERTVRTMNEDTNRWGRLAEAVEARRDQLKLSNRDLSRRSGVSEDTISKIVNTRQDGYRGSTLKRLAEALEWPDVALHQIVFDGIDYQKIPDWPPASPVGSPAPDAGPTGDLEFRVLQLESTLKEVVSQLRSVQQTVADRQERR